MADTVNYDSKVTAPFFITRLHLQDGRVANIADTTSNYIKYIQINGQDAKTQNARDRIYLRLNKQQIPVSLEQDENKKTILAVDQHIKVNGAELDNSTGTIEQKILVNGVQLENKKDTIKQYFKVNNETLTNQADSSEGTNTIEQHFQINGTDLDIEDGTINQTLKVNDVNLVNKNNSINQIFKINNTKLTNVSNTNNNTISFHLRIDGKDESVTTVNNEQIVDLSKATTSQYGVTKLSSAIDSDSEVLAATPKAVKQVETDLSEAEEEFQNNINEVQENLDDYEEANNTRVSKIEEDVKNNKKAADKTQEALDEYKTNNDERVSNLEQTVTDNKESANATQEQLDELEDALAAKTTIADYNITDAKITYDDNNHPIITLGDKTVKPVTSDSGNVPLANIDNADELKKIEQIGENGDSSGRTYGLLNKNNDGTWSYSTASGTGTITAIKANGELISDSGEANIPAASTEKYGVVELASNLIVDEDSKADETKAIDSKALLDEYIILSDTQPTSQVRGEFWYEILPDED